MCAVLGFKLISAMEQKNNSVKLASNTVVVAEALKALEKEQSNVVTGGWLNKLIVNLPRFFPRSILVGQLAKISGTLLQPTRLKKMTTDPEMPPLLSRSKMAQQSASKKL